MCFLPVFLVFYLIVAGEKYGKHGWWSYARLFCVVKWLMQVIG